MELFEEHISNVIKLDYNVIIYSLLIGVEYLNSNLFF